MVLQVLATELLLLIQYALDCKTLNERPAMQNAMPIAYDKTLTINLVSQRQ
ncbi:MAG: hypothetical protein ACI9ES_002777 [Oceanospirillaceae bacterium]|jgi:hypothetical protein